MKKTIFILVFLFLFLACGGGSNPPSVPAVGTATVYWNADTVYTDGSPLIVYMYKIYYGTSSSTYTKSINVDGNLTTYVIDNLPTGNTYYFVVTALDSNNRESALSTEVSKKL
jgi:fibronectin type 3 domain-containing protein